ncbi:MAG: hypothetical protein WED82_01905 [Balneolales bacterium]
MAKQFSAISKVSYADTAEGAQTDITGKIDSSSTFEVDNTKNETTDGSAYGGSLARCEINFLDHADYDDIETMMLADTEKFWFFHYKDGRTLRTAEAVNPFARLGTGVNGRDGAIAWILDFEQYSHQPMIVVD